MTNSNVVPLNYLGIDVAKDWLDIYDGSTVIRIDNEPRAIKAFLKLMPDAMKIAIESTNFYHEAFLELAISQHHDLYLIDAYRLSRYRDAVGVRVKTDAEDARLLYRYLAAEFEQLTPFKAPPKAVKRLQSLLKARATLAQSKTRIGLSLKSVTELASTRKALIARIVHSMAVIDRRIAACIKKAGYHEDYERCQSIPGVGPINAAALVMIYHRGVFRSADAFISFMGLDVRVRESGHYRGKRKLTKRGNPELRRLLFNAARAGARTAQWNPYYLSLRSRGHSTTAAAVALSRKIARLAFALLRDQCAFKTSANA